jgi:hypothetical protein
MVENSEFDKYVTNFPGKNMKRGLIDTFSIIYKLRAKIIYLSSAFDQIISFMSTKDFCDICDKEIKKDQHRVKIWRYPMKMYCLDCWMDKKKWQTIHSLSLKKASS